MSAVQRGVVAIVRRAGQYLVIRRAAGVAAPGAWCFVGGALESGESEQAAVAREFREEVGGAVTASRRVWEYHSPDGRLRLSWWLANLADGPLQANPAEVAELRWLAPAEIARLPGLLDSNRAFLDWLARADTALDGRPVESPRRAGFAGSPDAQRGRHVHGPEHP